jgi:hypothetical protein
MKTDSPTSKAQKQRQKQIAWDLGIRLPNWWYEAATVREITEFVTQTKEHLYHWLRTTDNLNCSFDGCGMRFNPHVLGRNEPGEGYLTGWQTGVPDTEDCGVHQHQLRNDTGVIYPSYEADQLFLQDQASSPTE